MQFVRTKVSSNASFSFVRIKGVGRNFPVECSRGRLSVNCQIAGVEDLTSIFDSFSDQNKRMLLAMEATALSCPWLPMLMTLAHFEKTIAARRQFAPQILNRSPEETAVRNRMKLTIVVHHNMIYCVV